MRFIRPAFVPLRALASFALLVLFLILIDRAVLGRTPDEWPVALLLPLGLGVCVLACVTLASIAPLLGIEDKPSMNPRLAATPDGDGESSRSRAYSREERMDDVRDTLAGIGRRVGHAVKAGARLVRRLAGHVPGLSSHAWVWLRSCLRRTAKACRLAVSRLGRHLGTPGRFAPHPISPATMLGRPPVPLIPKTVRASHPRSGEAPTPGLPAHNRSRRAQDPEGNRSSW